MVTCGDLGTEPWELESNLRRIFKDATTWNAVLLLDEADIFLQMRDYKDINRNALVSVFLRELEYFDGILFLTTNRESRPTIRYLLGPRLIVEGVGAIDEAFQSRIHVTLGLPLLDEDSRRDIWKIFIKDLQGTHRDSRKDLLKHVNAKLGKCNLNGRQIRNCVRTALALADQSQEPISARHLDDVVKMGEEFAEYMKTLHKMDSGKWLLLLLNIR
jgi:SpoVK/Ycf46/Vps4 family AAA+-type ATPase